MKRKCVVVFSKLVGIFPTLLVAYAGNFLTELIYGNISHTLSLCDSTHVGIVFPHFISVRVL